MGRTLAPRPE